MIPIQKNVLPSENTQLHERYTLVHYQREEYKEYSRERVDFPARQISLPSMVVEDMERIMLLLD